MVLTQRYTVRHDLWYTDILKNMIYGGALFQVFSACHCLLCILQSWKLQTNFHNANNLLQRNTNELCLARCNWLLSYKYWPVLQLFINPFQQSWWSILYMCENLNSPFNPFNWLYHLSKSLWNRLTLYLYVSHDLPVFCFFFQIRSFNRSLFQQY